MNQRERMAALERRYFDPRIETRSTGETTLQFHGYATAYDQWYDVAGGPEAGGWRERIAERAARMTLNQRPDVRLLVDHNPTLVLARTLSGTLELDDDPMGLRSFAPALDLRDPDAQSIAVKLERQDVDSMSLAFRAVKQEWNRDYTERTIREIDLGIKGSDVSIVTFPANDAAVAMMRSTVFVDGAVRSIDELRSSVERTSYLPLGVAKAIREQLRLPA